MKLDQRQVEEILIFDIDGDFDSRYADQVKEEIRSAIQEGNTDLLINMKGVPYMDSAGLGTLVSALKTAKESGGNVWLAGLTSQVKMVIELTRLHHVFDIFNSVEDALKELTGAEASEE